MLLTTVVLFPLQVSGQAYGGGGYSAPVMACAPSPPLAAPPSSAAARAPAPVAAAANSALFWLLSRLSASVKRPHEC